MKTRAVVEVIGLVSLLLVSGRPARAQQPPEHEPSAEERVAALKASLAASQTALQKYEWVETTIVSVGGEEKSRSQNQCYYGADGKVQKVPVAAPPPPEEGRGRRQRGVKKRIVESKKEEMTDYMKAAVGLVQMYVPPDPARIQAVQGAGQMTIQPLTPDQSVRLVFAGYMKPGDSFSVDLDQAKNQILQVGIATYLDSEEDPVTLQVRFGTLPGNVSYASDVVLEAKAKDLNVTIQNTEYRATGS